jgi:hypothetical protein
VKLAKSSTKLKAKIGWPILLKTAIEFCFFVPFIISIILILIRNWILPEMDEEDCFRL